MTYPNRRGGPGLTPEQEETLKYFRYDPVKDRNVSEKALETTVNSLFLEDAWSLNSAGVSIGTKDISKNIFYRIFSGVIGDSMNPYIIKERNPFEFVAQPIDTDLLVNPNYSLVIPVADPANPEDGQNVLKVKVKVDPSSVINNTRITFRINGTIFAIEIIDLIPLGGNLYDLVYQFPFDVNVGDLVEVSIDSDDGDVVWLGDSVSGVPYLEPTVTLWDRAEVAFKEDLPKPPQVFKSLAPAITNQNYDVVKQLKDSFNFNTEYTRAKITFSFEGSVNVTNRSMVVSIYVNGVQFEQQFQKEMKDTGDEIYVTKVFDYDFASTGAQNISVYFGRRGGGVSSFVTLRDVRVFVEEFKDV